jgi:integrase
MPKFTKAAVAKLALPTGKADHTFYDDDLPGFGLRMRAGGRRAWVAVYRVGAKVKRVSLGTADVVKPEEAREAARRVLARADLGHDTAAERREERARSAVTLRTIIDAYLAQHVEPKQKARTKVETKRHLEQHWRPLHATPLHLIGRREVAARLAELVAESGPVAANRARACLSALFAWAMKAGLAEVAANPVVGTLKPGAERPRERVLTAAELREVWQACEDDDHGRIVRLLMLTGQRREEVAGMAWGEVDGGKALWSLPGGRTKNGLPHDVPLSDAALTILAGVERREGRDLLFGRLDGPFSGWSRCKARLDERIAAARAKAAGRGKPAKEDQLAPWVLHDLRRTVVTGMAELGVQPHVIEAVVNHVSGHKAGVAGVYNRATYAAEKRAALALWGAHVAALVADEPAKVLPFRQRSA